jgi:hypothetical protein
MLSALDRLGLRVTTHVVPGHPRTAPWHVPRLTRVRESLGRRGPLYGATARGVRWKPWPLSRRVETCRRSRRRKADDVIAHRGVHFAEAPGGDHHELFALVAEPIRHRCGLRACGEFPFPQLLPGLHVESAKIGRAVGGALAYSRSSVLLANISSGLTLRGRIFWSWANWITASTALRLRARPLGSGSSPTRRRRWARA